MDPVTQALQMEASRRFAGGAPSSAGIGAPVANSQSPANPLAQRGMVPTPTPSTPSNPTMPTGQDPFGGASAAMNGSMPVKGGTNLEKALVKRMMMYPPA